MASCEPQNIYIPEDKLVHVTHIAKKNLRDHSYMCNINANSATK